MNLRPSASARWMTCTASVKFIEDNAYRLPKKRDTAYTEEGRAAHKYAERMLKGEEVDIESGEMWTAVNAYVEYCLDLPGMRLIEHTVPLWYNPGQSGTVDCAAIDIANKAIWIVDLKYGAGIEVEAEDNSQLMIYAASILTQLEPDRAKWCDWAIDLTIIQPRHFKSSEAPCDSSMDGTELAAFADTVDKAVLAIRKGGAKFCPSDKACQWCHAKGLCPSRPAEALEVLPVEAQNAVAIFPNPKGLTTAQLGRIVQVSKKLTQWLSDCEAVANEMALAGTAIPGCKLVESKKHRRWKDETAAATALAPFVGKENLYGEPKFISPAQAEKLLKNPKKPLSTQIKNKMAFLIEQPEGDPTLVPVEDPRPEIEDLSKGFQDETLL